MPTRILIVDDDERLTEMLAGYLVSRGYEVERRFDGESGVRAATARPPANAAPAGGGPFDAVILDVMLPDIDGFEVCRRIRGRSEVPILMLTARGDAMDRVVGLEIGADDYLPKPFEPRELLARLGAILRRTQKARQQQPGQPHDGARDLLSFGPLAIDRQTRQVHVRGERRELTGRQFELLWFLASRAGRVQSREQITEALGQDEWDSVDRAIDVHVSRIRGAIEDDPRRPQFLQTVRGAGYVFSPPRAEGHSPGESDTADKGRPGQT